MDREIYEKISLSKIISTTDLETALERSTEAVTISRKKDLPYELAYCLLFHAWFLSEKGENPAVLESIFEAVHLAKDLKNKELLFMSYSKLGSIYLRFGDLDKSLSIFKTALAKRSFHEREDFSEIYFGMGTVLSYKGNDREALSYFTKGLEYSEKFENLQVKSKLLNNMGCSYHYLNDYVKAEEYLNRCIELCRKYSFTDILVTALDELGLINKKRDNDRAVEIWNEALALSRSRGSSFISFGPLLSLSTYYNEKGQWEKADSYLREAKKTAVKSGSKIDLVDLYKLETRTYEARGDYKTALEANKKYLALVEEIQKQESVWELKNQELELLTETRDKILALSKVGRLMTSSLDLSTVLTSSYENLKEFLNFSILGIAQYNAEERIISYKLFIEDDKIQPEIDTTADDPNSLAAWAIRNDKKITISDFEKEYSQYVTSEIKSLSLETEINKMPQSIIYNPLKIENRIIGVITIQSYEKEAFTSKDTDSFNIFSSYVAIALNNALQSQQIQNQNRELSRLATTDSLTGLHNRRYFFDSMKRFCSLAVRKQFPISLIMLDLDHFKSINDTYGHPAGDYVLKEISGIISAYAKREHDDAARLGGEEFGIFLGDTDIQAAGIIAEKIRKSIETHTFQFNDKTIEVTSSLGIATRSDWTETVLNVDQFFNTADKMLYTAKEAGRNCVRSGLI